LRKPAIPVCHNEASLIGQQGGAGRHKGRLGALLVRLLNGTEFAISTGFNDREQKNRLPICSIGLCGRGV